MRQFRDFDISIQPVQLSGGQGRAGGGYAAGIPVIVIKGPGIISDGLAELEGTTPTEIAERSAGNLLRTPWLETEDIVEAFKYIASDRARFLTGSQFVLDAGLLTA